MNKKIERRICNIIWETHCACRRRKLLKGPCATGLAAARSLVGPKGQRGRGETGQSAAQDRERTRRPSLRGDPPPLGCSAVLGHRHGVAVLAAARQGSAPLDPAAVRPCFCFCFFFFSRFRWPALVFSRFRLSGGQPWFCR